MSAQERIRLYLGFSIPAHCSRVPHLPVLNELGPRAEPGSIGKVLIQKCSRHGWNHKRTGSFWTPGCEKKKLFFLTTYVHYFFLNLHLWRFFLLWAVVLRSSRLQQDGGGASFSVGGAPLYPSPLHSQLLAYLLDLRLQKTFLRFQPLLLRLSETAVTSPVKPKSNARRAWM